MPSVLLEGAQGNSERTHSAKGTTYRSMRNDFEQDIQASFALLNYLNASCQGHFAALNVLSQLRFPNLSEEEVTFVRDALTKIARWTEELWQHQPLISARWTTPETFDAIHAVELLEAEKGDLGAYVSASHRALSLELAQEPEAPKVLIAAFARYIYSRDNYIRGFIRYGEATGKREVVEVYRDLLERSSEELQFSQLLLTTFRDAPSVDGRFFHELAFRCRLLPMAFASHIHDINQLLAQFRGGVSFRTLDFSEQEEQEWLPSGLPPVAAGYWRAHLFSPQEAAQWASLGVTDAPTAFTWREHGFTAPVAIEWLRAGFAPGVAQRWAQAHYEPEDAREYLEQGITDPRALER